MAEEGLTYDKAQLNQLIRAFKAMDDEAAKVAAETGFEFSNWVAAEIQKTAYSRYVNPTAVRRIVDGKSISRTSKVGQISYGFARQRFSGGGTTRSLWAGFEFGSKRFKQFPSYSGRYGRGGRGWFIFPTLRRLQPQLVRKWEQKFDQILIPWKRGY
jgi:hypothetical protein